MKSVIHLDNIRKIYKMENIELEDLKGINLDIYQNEKRRPGNY